MSSQAAANVHSRFEAADVTPSAILPDPVPSLRRRTLLPRGIRAARAEYDFLLPDLQSEQGLLEASARAAHCGLAVQRILIGEGRIDPAAYVAALARSLGLTYLPEPAAAGLRTGRRPGQAGQTWATGHIDGVPWVVFDGTSASPSVLAALAQRLTARGRVVGLTPPQGIRDCVLATVGHRILRDAVSGLARSDPTASARAGSWLWQSVCIASGFGLVLGLIISAGLSPEHTLTALVTLPFLALVLFRLTLLGFYPGAPEASPAAHRTADRDLPVYTVLVPLYREAHVLPGLVAALRQLDYPGFMAQTPLRLWTDHDAQRT